MAVDVDRGQLLLAGVASSPLIGLGPQGVRETLAGSIRQGFDPGNHAHNTALQILVEGGLIGFTAYLLFIWGIWRIASQSALGNALLLLFMIRSFSEATLPWSQVWIWFFAAIYSGLAIEHSPRIVHEAEPSNSQQQNNTPVLSGG
ncbi:hypothetical protein EON82_26595 [bacterium]|nr:MAG: hypothetical protein EON82_26595 [bacterium]